MLQETSYSDCFSMRNHLDPSHWSSPSSIGRAELLKQKTEAGSVVFQHHQVPNSFGIITARPLNAKMDWLCWPINQKPEWDRQNKMQCGLGLVEKEAEKYQAVYLHFHLPALLMILNDSFFFIKSHHVESTCLGNVLTQEFFLAPYERHCFNRQIHLYHDLWHRDEETIKRDRIEGDQTGSLSKTSHRGIQGRMHDGFIVHKLWSRSDRMRQKNVRERHQTTESLSYILLA